MVAPARPASRPDPTRPLRFGVEEEFVLVDAVTGVCVPRAGQVLADAAMTLGDRAQAEFCATQVEGCTPPVETPEQLRAELASMRHALAAAAGRAGCLLVASGTPVLPSPHPLPVSDGARYHRISRHMGPVADQPGGEMCGCHVHVGDLSRREALAVGNRLRPWLPVLHAVTTNSPFCEGRDRGVASSRTLCYGRWPTVGPAPLLDESGYERTVEALVSSGVLLDRRMVYWYSRPSEHLPTLEVRVADVNADLDVTVLLAVLVRALVEMSLREEAAGAPMRPVAEDALCRAHRRAARVGLSADGVDAFTGRSRPAPLLLADLLEHAAPGLDALGDLGLARRLAARTVAAGTGADRQRAAFACRGSLTDVVAELAAVTVGTTASADRSTALARSGGRSRQDRAGGTAAAPGRA
ncbi:glutamate--cysteine ligase [Kitasatospora sp. NPDC088346]|uniref:carboxylate-amine ligase n=1 Tax=Kitasatospora sp. NPDC088346 TaxID=3364073 RepID=UPI0037F76878